MNNKKIYFLLAGLLFAGLCFTSCKKEKQSSVPSLFTYGTWRLGSIQVDHYLGGTRLKPDTLDLDSIQTFVFNKDMTCSFTNFDNKAGTVSGTWGLSDTKLYMFANITYPEVTTDGTKQPFINCQIVNLGEYSMVIQTGDLQTYYNPTDTRTIRTYGFVRINPVGTQ
jgi:hypothetical protein